MANDNDGLIAQETEANFGLGCWNCGGPQEGRVTAAEYDELVQERDKYRETLEWIADGASGMYGVIRARQALDWIT